MNFQSRTQDRALDLADIQGNIVRPYGRFGFPITRHFFFNIGTADAGRNFVEQVRHQVTTAERWGLIDDDPSKQAVPRPLVAINIGFSYQGLAALALPTRTLANLPDEFIDGMAKRWSILGDFGPSAPGVWDPIWRAAQSQADKQIHICVSLNAQIKPDGAPVDELAATTAWLKTLAGVSSGVTLLTGHKGPNPEFQDSSAIMRELPDGTVIPTASEHFGFTDGIGDPTFAGQYEPIVENIAVIGSGKLAPDGKKWIPLAAGEFILGHANEAQELPPSAAPWSFMRNGTFMAYRKLHQNVACFNAYADQQAASLNDISPDEARAFVRAKMVGRWQSGIPLAIAPTYAQAQALEQQWADIPAIQLKGAARTAAESERLANYEVMLTNFRYNADLDGAKCPVTAHIRRSNPRDALDPLLTTSGSISNTALTNRRRIMRRGAPYGDPRAQDDASEHGVIFMALCASLFNQFEFVQQQWIHYGASFNAGNDTDPLAGLRRPGAKFVIPADPAQDHPPFICANMPQFVETRGGEYFFLPSLTALREIAQGSVDPT